MRSMTREDVFTSKTENSEPYYGLREPALEKIGPYNENLKLILGPTRLNSDSRLNSSNDPQTKRGPKRKASDSAYSNQSQSLNLNAGGSGAPANKKKVDDLKKIEKLVPRFYPTDHPYNKDNYRYHLVEPDPHSPMRQKFEETEFWAGKPLPGHLYRLFLEQRVALALADKAPQLKVSDDRLGVVGEKGYSMVRATHGVMHGAWYFEVVIREKPSAAALRIGWAQQNSGYDVNDVLGFYIELPLVDNSQLLPDSCKEMTLVKFKNHLYYEEVSKIRWSCVCVGATDSFDFFLQERRVQGGREQTETAQGQQDCVF